MTRTLPTRRMHEHPDLDQLKRQAKELLRAFLTGEPEVTVEIKAHYTRADRTTFALLRYSFRIMPNDQPPAN